MSSRTRTPFPSDCVDHLDGPELLCVNSAQARDRLSRSDSPGACRDSGGFGLNSGERGFNDSDVRPHVSHRLVEDGIDIFDYVAVLVGHDASGPDAVAFAARAFGGSSILCSSTRIQLADAMINDEA